MKFINKRHFIVLVAVFSMASLTGCKEAPQPEEAEQSQSPHKSWRRKESRKQK